MDQVIAHAPAKINLGLEVLPTRAGEEKHRLNSIFCTTSLCDTLVYRFVSGSEPFNVRIKVLSPSLDTSYLKENDNTLTKTVEHFKRVYGFGFLPSGTLQVELIKSIPVQAGLGGGSSDAAALLKMLCWLVQVEPLSENSLAVARAVGADVPFFLHAPNRGFCALMGGYGDLLAAILPKPQLHLMIVKPERGVSTKRAFACFDELAERGISIEPRSLDNGSIGDLADALTNGRQQAEIARLCQNDLEAAAMQILPQIDDLKAELLAFPGVLGAAMCGAGSSLFAICADAAAAHTSMQHFANQGLWAVVVTT